MNVLEGKQLCVSPKVAIIIVNWNKRDDTLKLLRSLEGLDYDNHDTVVVDNASTDGSAEAIRERFPSVELVVNTDNLGGTGGFNSGMRHALANRDYKYVWLLDNDAEVEPNTLGELVDAMERDETIGIAGSRIIDSDRRDITVEAGAFLKRDSIGVQPLYRNTRNLNIASGVIEVDYVAICSALARASALERVGLMDERYFFFWDDMDWGLQFKESGFKVVSVLSSIVYHPAFTEKRGIMADYYYGNRNSLLTYTKHIGLRNRVSVFYTYLRHKCTSLIFLGLNGREDTMKLGFEGILDFVVGRWGKKINNGLPNEASNESTDFPGNVRNVLILNDGDKDEIHNAYNFLSRIYPEASFTLLISDDRKDFFDKDFQNLIKINTTKPYSILYLLPIFVKMLFKKFDIAVSFRNSSPFSFAAVKSYSFQSMTMDFNERDSNFHNVWKLILSLIIGEMMSILLLPIIYISSFRYAK
ncbi:MAG: glycosyltransferase family 2 protein [Thermodesulfobacteriota bacterium]